MTIKIQIGFFVKHEKQTIKLIQQLNSFDISEAEKGGKIYVTMYIKNVCQKVLVIKAIEQWDATES